MPLSEELAQFDANPFVLSSDERGKAEAKIASLPQHRVVAELLDSEDTIGAERAVMAMGLVAAARGETKPLALPERTWARLPKKPLEYWRISRGAGRGYGALSRLVGDSDAIARLRAEAWAGCFGDSLHRTLDLEPVIIDHDVLILGETGTGKELIANAIQAALPGDRQGEPAPHSALNAAAVPETLIESELFGHVKGAFTGALESRRGRIRGAHGGSFFIDEVGDLKETTQVKLLRVMETNSVSPIGSDVGEEANCRYVAATHRDIEAMVEAGEFRRDMFQRLAGLVIRVPPLRDRLADIPAIGRAFVERYSVPGEVAERVDEWLHDAARSAYSWPGNVRELQNRLRSVMLGLGSKLTSQSAEVVAAVIPAAFAECDATLKELDDWYLARVLLKVEGNFAAAARILDVDRATIRRRAQQLGS